MRRIFINKLLPTLIALFSIGNVSAAEGVGCFGPTKEKEFSANEYISHHLSHCTVDSPLGIIHIDSVFYAVFMAVLFLFVFLKSFDPPPSIAYAARVQGLPQKPIKGMSFGSCFLVSSTALKT